MKSQLFFRTLLFGSLFVWSTVSQAQWQTDVRLTNDPGGSSTNDNCLAASGNFVHDVWRDNRAGGIEIYYKRSTDAGISWQADTRLTNDPATSEG